MEEITDMYIPSARDPLSLRIRQRGNKREITKKEPLDMNDSTHQAEDTILLTEKEYETLMKAPGKILRKTRYYYDYCGKTAENENFIAGGALAGKSFKDIEDNLRRYNYQKLILP